MTSQLLSNRGVLSVIVALLASGTTSAGIPFLQTASDSNLTLVPQVTAGGRVIIANVKNSTEESWILDSIECKIRMSFFEVCHQKRLENFQLTRFSAREIQNSFN